jgi:hypothetical protein
VIQRRTGLKRTGYIRPKPRRRPPVKDWDGLREKVFLRDVAAIVRHFRKVFHLEAIKARFDGELTLESPLQWEVCVAAMLDVDEQGACSGSWEANHVEDPAKPMRGRKAPDDVDHLVSLCEYHHRTSVAGHIWAAVKKNKILLWEYLEEQRDADQATV